MRGRFMRRIRRIGGVWLCNCVRRTGLGQLVQFSGCVDIFAFVGIWISALVFLCINWRLHVYQI